MSDKPEVLAPVQLARISCELSAWHGIVMVDGQVTDRHVVLATLRLSAAGRPDQYQMSGFPDISADADALHRIRDLLGQLPAPSRLKIGLHAHGFAVLVGRVVAELAALD